LAATKRPAGVNRRAPPHSRTRRPAAERWR